LVNASGPATAAAMPAATAIPHQRGSTKDPSTTGRRGRLRATVASTPGRFATAMIVILLIGLGYGTAALIGAVQRDGAVHRMRTTSGPLTVSAQSLYRSLYDADATAAAAFLSGGAEPKTLRDRYDNDIAAASAALAEVAADRTANPASIATLSANLPVYTGLVATARADNRTGYPVGAAYLREASSLMHNTLLQAAQSVYQAELVGMDTDRKQAVSFPWLAVPLGLLLLAVLAATARYLARRTNRIVNAGVTTAVLAVVISMIWMVASWGAAATHLHKAESTGSAQVKGLITIRIAVLQARGYESLTLVARGSGSAYEDDFTQTMNRVLGTSKATGFLTSAQADATDPEVRKLTSSVAADLRGWVAAHKQLRDRDDSGDYPDAVEMAIGAGATDTPAYFNRVDRNLAAAIDLTSKEFSDQAGAAAAAQGGEGVAVTVLVVIALVAATIGLQRRIAEYR
jgi:hypothetical protein